MIIELAVKSGASTREPFNPSRSRIRNTGQICLHVVVLLSGKRPTTATGNETSQPIRKSHNKTQFTAGSPTSRLRPPTRKLGFATRNQPESLDALYFTLDNGYKLPSDSRQGASRGCASGPHGLPSPPGSPQKILTSVSLG